MKKLLLCLLIAGTGFAAKWYKIEIPLDQNIPVELISSLDVIAAKPGYWAEVAAVDAELRMLEEAGVSFRIVIEDLTTYYASTMVGDGPFGNYYTHAEAVAIIDSLHDMYPEIITARMDLPNDDYDGLTWDGNTVWAIKISDNVDEDEGEPEALFTGIHHAREPISCNVTVEWARWLCENYGENPLATYLVEDREIWIIPILNPDGYLYNEEIAPGGGGMHRKNRRQTSVVNPGVDLNRNYPYKWGYDNQGSSPNPSSQTYRGPEPASEPETQSIMNLCKSREFVTALNFHSAGGWFLYPWGYEDVRCDDSTAYYHWGEIGTRDCHYTVVPGFGLYNTNGDSDDWMYGEIDAKPRIFAVTPEVGTQFWQDWFVDQHVAETRALLISAAKAAGVYPELEWVYFSDGGDDVISPGETVDLLVQVRNMSVRDESGDISLELSTEHDLAEITTPTAKIYSLEPMMWDINETDPLQVTISASAKPGNTIPVTLVISTATEEFTHEINLPVGERVYLIDEDFEDQGWQDWSTNWGGLTEDNPHSGNYAFTESPSTGYADNSFYYFSSPTFDMTNLTAAELRFWNRFAIEEGWDWAILQFRSDSTDGWVTLQRWGGMKNTTWTEERFDLCSYCGAPNAQIQFVLETDQAVYFDGWVIDDIVLTAFPDSGSASAVHELAEIRQVIAPRESITTGQLSFAGIDGTEVEVTVYDASGRQVAETRSVTPFTWELTDGVGRPLPAGTYFVFTSYPGGETNRKVVVVD